MWLVFASCFKAQLLDPMVSQVRIYYGMGSGKAVLLSQQIERTIILTEFQYEV